MPRSKNLPPRLNQSQQPVFARLQNLFPQTPTHPHAQSEKALPPLPSGAPKLRKALKVRIITWNMHDSVPKGDLEELLGKVPLWTPPDDEEAISSIPAFTLDDAHPYHLVVV
ncbi:hypothetical protein H0H92_009031 [Tricholoma furcatifolium]|nr:hypothetical protein H0H92_009031 [Tricholoma furcatifolium]